MGNTTSGVGGVLNVKDYTYNLLHISRGLCVENYIESAINLAQYCDIFTNLSDSFYDKLLYKFAVSMTLRESLVGLSL